MSDLFLLEEFIREALLDEAKRKKQMLEDIQLLLSMLNIEKDLQLSIQVGAEKV